MKKHAGRRDFLKKISISSISAGVIPATLAEGAEVKTNGFSDPVKKITKAKAGRQYNEAYEGAYLNRVAFPIGGLGGGMFCLEGTGAVSHMSVRNRPDVFNEPGMFGAIAVKGEKTTAKILEGPSPDWKRFGQPNSGNGSGGSIFGLPRYDKASFLARFPFATITLEDEDFPLKAKLTGWSPFIPTDADNSGLPAGALEYKLVNTGDGTADCVFSFHAKNFMKHAGGGITSIKRFPNGFILSNQGTDEKPFLGGDFVVFSDQDDTVVDHCWFRGGWFDPLTITWDTIRSGSVKQVEPVASDAPGASLYVPFRLAPGEEKVIRVLTAWYVPVTDLRYGEDGTEQEKCDPASGCCSSSSELGENVADASYAAGMYKPWYSHRFGNVTEVAGYWKSQYQALEKKIPGIQRGVLFQHIARRGAGSHRCKPYHPQVSYGHAPV